MSENILTGRKFLIIIVSAFALIIGVNLTMAYMAISTFPGLVVKNSYVASQSFDKDRKAQIALGWTVSGDVLDGAVRLSILDRAENPVRVARLDVSLGRPTHVGEDQQLQFSFDGTAYVAPVELGTGSWNLHIDAVAGDGTKFRQLVALYVKRKK